MLREKLGLRPTPSQDVAIRAQCGHHCDGPLPRGHPGSCVAWFPEESGRGGGGGDWQEQSADVMAQGLRGLGWPGPRAGAERVWEGWGVPSGHHSRSLRAFVLIKHVRFLRNRLSLVGTAEGLPGPPSWGLMTQGWEEGQAPDSFLSRTTASPPILATRASGPDSDLNSPQRQCLLA